MRRNFDPPIQIPKALFSVETKRYMESDTDFIICVQEKEKKEKKKDDNYCTYVGDVFQVLFSCSTFP